MLKRETSGNLLQALEDLSPPASTDTHLSEESLNYERILLQLREAADRERGIEWHNNEEMGVITRIVPFSEIKGPLFSYYDYKQQIVNLYRAAEEIVSVSPKKEVIKNTYKQQLRNKAIAVLQETPNKLNDIQCQNWLKQHNTTVSQLLQLAILPEHRLQEISTILRKAEAFASLGDKQHHQIRTITKIRDQYFLQADTPISNTSLKESHLLLEHQNQPWYQHLEPVEKALFDKHRNAIVDGRHILPVSLREILGLRNAYKKSVSMMTATRNGFSAPVYLGGYMHSASIVGTQRNTQVREEVARENYRQLCEANPGKTVDVLTLCSRIPAQGLWERLFPTLSAKLLDAHVVDTTAQVVGREALIVIPTNVLRCISRNTIYKTCNSIIGDYLEKTNIQHSPQLQPLFNYLTTKISFNRVDYRQVYGSINTLTDLNARILAQEMVELRRLQFKQSGFRGRLNSFFETITAPFRQRPRNKNARIAAKLTTLWEKVYSDRTLCLSCKSGKDRTGYESFLVDSGIIKMGNPRLTQGEIQGALAQSSHVQFLPSTAGGKPGCFGLKGVQVDRYDRESPSVSGKLFAGAARSSSEISLLRTNGRPSVDIEISPPVSPSDSSSPLLKRFSQVSWIHPQHEEEAQQGITGISLHSSAAVRIPMRAHTPHYDQESEEITLLPLDIHPCSPLMDPYFSSYLCHDTAIPEEATPENRPRSSLGDLKAQQAFESTANKRKC